MHNVSGIWTLRWRGHLCFVFVDSRAGADYICSHQSPRMRNQYWLQFKASCFLTQSPVHPALPLGALHPLLLPPPLLVPPVHPSSSREITQTLRSVLSSGGSRINPEVKLKVFLTFHFRHSCAER